MSRSFWDHLPSISTLDFSGVVVLLVTIIWSIRRHRDPELKIECDFPIDKLVPFGTLTAR